MPEDSQISASRAIQRQTGSTFYVATRALPERVRDPTHVLYALFRIADEVVDADDATERSAAAKREELAALRAQALGTAEPEGPVLEAFAALRTAYDIPAAEIDAFFDAMERDLEVRRYEDFDELRSYMRGSAAAVGAMMTAIMVPTGRDRAMSHARALGEAFQLTNFLRDVREDLVDLDRIYLPERTLQHHGADHGDVESLTMTDGLGASIQTLVGRAEQLYRHGVAGIELLPRDCQFPVLLASVLYADYHRAIRRQQFDVLSDPPALGRWRTASLYARTRVRWQFDRDPASVFGTVSPISMDESDDSRMSDERLSIPTP